MSISVQWLNTEQTVLYLRFRNHWTLDDYYTALERANRWIEQVGHAVQVIADLHDVYTFPQGIITHASNGLLSRPRNVHSVAVVITAPIIVQMYHTVLRFFKITHPDTHVPLEMVNSLAVACQRVGVSTDMLQEILS